MKQGEKQGKEGAIRRKIIRLVLSISLLALLLVGSAAYALWYHLRVNSQPRCKMRGRRVDCFYAS